MENDKTTKRERGTGSIKKISEKQYLARLQYISPLDGKTHDKRKICASESEAKRLLREWQNKIILESTLDYNKTSVERFITTWLECFKKPDLKPRAYDSLESTIKTHIIPTLGKLQVGAISPEEIQGLLNDLQREGKSYSTIKKVYDAINACFKWGVVGRKIPFNPVSAVTIPGGLKQKKNKDKINKEKVKFFTEEQQDKIIAAALEKYPTGVPVYRYGYAIPLLLNTGIRLGELLGLRWKRDVDFEKRTISIANSMVVIRNREGNAETKTVMLEQDSVKSVSGERVLYLNDEALDALQHLYEITGKNTYVISTQSGKSVQPSTIDRMMRTVLVRAGIPKGSNQGVHALRHTFASNLFRAGEDPKVVSELLGHSEIGITMDIYTHLVDEQKKSALVKIANRKTTAKEDPDEQDQPPTS